ncbi:hypothetical protein T4C_4692 [Trichinella pseudospiralis]|uniref:Uncharacterized protein n=1 Tax=Trichinella pseudospiralis TaxID=6337 RepID=A0A0V1GQS6_TRIPS|nr:hypothetical protein T4C_4692 [Trichinella pseudospiralis]
MNAHTSSVLAVNHQYIKNEKQKCNKSKTSRTIHSKGIGGEKNKLYKYGKIFSDRGDMEMNFVAF